MSEKFGKEEREKKKRNYAVMAEEKVKFCGASAQQGKVQQICPADDQRTGRSKY